MESQLKMKKLERDMPKFLRAQRNYIKTFDDQIKKINSSSGVSTEDYLNEQEQESFAYQRETIEQMI